MTVMRRSLGPKLILFSFIFNDHTFYLFIFIFEIHRMNRIGVVKNERIRACLDLIGAPFVAYSGSHKRHTNHRHNASLFRKLILFFFIRVRVKYFNGFYLSFYCSFSWHELMTSCAFVCIFRLAGIWRLNIQYKLIFIPSKCWSQKKPAAHWNNMDWA